MIYLHKFGDVQVLSFDSTEEARSVGGQLAAMGDGCRFYAIGPDDKPEAIHEAIRRAKDIRLNIPE